MIEPLKLKVRFSDCDMMQHVNNAVYLNYFEEARIHYFRQILGIEWDCGKLAGVVDCNEKLELDEASNTVITVSAKKPFSGQCETCHMNGILERRVTFVGGKQNGTDTTYYASGCPMVIRTHVKGVENGHWAYFYDSLGTVEIGP